MLHLDRSIIVVKIMRLFATTKPPSIPHSKTAKQGYDNQRKMKKLGYGIPKTGVRAPPRVQKATPTLQSSPQEFNAVNRLFSASKSQPRKRKRRKRCPKKHGLITKNGILWGTFSPKIRKNRPYPKLYPTFASDRTPVYATICFIQKRKNRVKTRFLVR
jgi:hypothetical protein